MKKKCAMLKRFEEFLRTAPKEDVSRILFMLQVVDKATPDEMKEFKTLLKKKDFNAREWIDSKIQLKEGA